MRWSLILTLIGVFLWNQSAVSAKVGRYTDQQGNLHISNDPPAEPAKPGEVQAPAPIGTPPPQMFRPPTPPMTPPESSGNEAPPPAPESGGEDQPAPAVPLIHVAPGQQE